MPEYTICYTIRMGIARYQFRNVPQFGQFYKKVVLRLSKHDDVIETQTVRFGTPQSFLANSVSGMGYT